MHDHYTKPKGYVISPDQKLARRVFRHVLEGPTLDNAEVHPSLMSILDRLSAEGINEAVFNGEGHSFLVKWSPINDNQGD